MNLFSILKPKGDIVYLRAESTISQALEKMCAHSYTALPVVDRNGHYVGSVNEGDFLWYILQQKTNDLHELEYCKLSEIIRKGWMPSASIYISKEELLERAMSQNYIPVTDDRDIFIGIITRRDIISWIAVLNEISAAKL